MNDWIMSPAADIIFSIILGLAFICYLIQVASFITSMIDRKNKKT